MIFRESKKRTVGGAELRFQPGASDLKVRGHCDSVGQSTAVNSPDQAKGFLNTGAAPSSRSISSSRLNLAIRSLRQADPVLI